MALLRGQIAKTKELRPERDLNPRPLAFEACSRPLCSNRCLNLHLVKTWKHSGQNFTKREQNQQIRLSLLSPHFSLFSETTMAAFVPLPVINWLAFLTIVALFWPEYLFLSFWIFLFPPEAHLKYFPSPTRYDQCGRPFIVERFLRNVSWYFIQLTENVFSSKQAWRRIRIKNRKIL